MQGLEAQTQAQSQSQGQLVLLWVASAARWHRLAPLGQALPPSWAVVATLLVALAVPFGQPTAMRVTAMAAMWRQMGWCDRPLVQVVVGPPAWRLVVIARLSRPALSATAAVGVS